MPVSQAAAGGQRRYNGHSLAHQHILQSQHRSDLGQLTQTNLRTTGGRPTLEELSPVPVWMGRLIMVGLGLFLPAEKLTRGSQS